MPVYRLCSLILTYLVCQSVLVFVCLFGPISLLPRRSNLYFYLDKMLTVTFLEIHQFQPISASTIKNCYLITYRSTIKRFNCKKKIRRGSPKKPGIKHLTGYRIEKDIEE